MENDILVSHSFVFLSSFHFDHLPQNKFPPVPHLPSVFIMFRAVDSVKGWGQICGPLMVKNPNLILKDYRLFDYMQKVRLQLSCRTTVNTSISEMNIYCFCEFLKFDLSLVLSVSVSWLKGFRVKMSLKEWRSFWCWVSTRRNSTWGKQMPDRSQITASQFTPPPLLFQSYSLLFRILLFFKLLALADYNFSF